MDVPFNQGRDPEKLPARSLLGISLGYSDLKYSLRVER